ncbi:MAG: hypothetical protein HC841_02065 [Verrucomicrobiae bacterium]|nr:hypothetical protein [Verrucomicrobiae bacterium]
MRVSPLAGSSLHVAGSNVAAGREPGEPVHAGNPGGRSVWYSWTAPASGHVWLSTNPPPALLQPRWEGVTEVVFQDPGGGTYGLITYISLNFGCGNQFDGSPPPPFFPVFGVYTGNSVAALTPVGSGTNGLWFEAVQGRTYRIAVDGNLGSAGAFAFHLVQFPAPPNDAFAGRIAVAGTKIDIEGNNVSARADAAGPAHSVWWSWTAPTFGAVQLTGTGSDAEFPLAVFTGNNIGELQTVAAGLGGLSFNATLGTTYQIALGSANGVVGNYHLQLTSPPVVIVAPLVTPSGFQRVLHGFPGADGQLLLIQSRGSSQGAWNNVALAQVRDGMAKPASLPASFPFWQEFRALVVETPFTLPRPVMRHTGLQPDGSYRLCIEGLPGLKCVIKTSTNLVDWEAVMTHTFDGAPFDYFHPASGDPQRYYRAEPVID